MADEPELTDRVRRLLEGQGDVVERRMFGSVGFLVGGVLRVGVGRHADHVMIAHVPRADAAAALLEPGIRPAVMRGRVVRGRLFLEDGAVGTDALLGRRIAAALAAAA